MGQDIAGWGSLVLGLALVVLHIVTTLQPRASGGTARGGDEAMGAVIDKLADKAPHLAGGLAFVVLGLIVLGYLDVSVVAGTNTGS